MVLEMSLGLDGSLENGEIFFTTNTSIWRKRIESSGSIQCSVRGNRVSGIGGIYHSSQDRHSALYTAL